MGAALLCLYRQALARLCTQQQAEGKEEAEAIQRISDALLLDIEGDGLPRLVVLDGQLGMCVLTPDDPEYAEVAERLVSMCPQVASLLTVHKEQACDAIAASQ